MEGMIIAGIFTLLGVVVFVLSKEQSKQKKKVSKWDFFDCFY